MNILQLYIKRKNDKREVIFFPVDFPLLKPHEFMTKCDSA